MELGLDCFFACSNLPSNWWLLMLLDEGWKNLEVFCWKQLGSWSEAWLQFLCTLLVEKKKRRRDWFFFCVCWIWRVLPPPNQVMCLFPFQPGERQHVAIFGYPHSWLAVDETWGWRYDCSLPCFSLFPLQTSQVQICQPICYLPCRRLKRMMRAPSLGEGAVWDGLVPQVQGDEVGSCMTTTIMVNGMGSFCSLNKDFAVTSSWFWKSKNFQMALLWFRRKKKGFINFSSHCKSPALGRSKKIHWMISSVFECRNPDFLYSNKQYEKVSA